MAVQVAVHHDTPVPPHLVCASQLLWGLVWRCQPQGSHARSPSQTGEEAAAEIREGESEWGCGEHAGRARTEKTGVFKSAEQSVLGMGQF